MNTHALWALWTEALAEAKAAQEQLAKDLYISKLETALSTLSPDIHQGSFTSERIRMTLRALDSIHPKLNILERVRILRAAFNLTLDEAKAQIADWDGENDLPF